jgi:NCAIR mutase (PurE)-related protein
MTKEELLKILDQYKRGFISEKSVAAKIAALGFESLGFAHVDHHRHLRQGFPEVILCEGKTPQQSAEIAARIYRRSEPLLATRATKDHFIKIKAKIQQAKYHPFARVITANEPKKIKYKGKILIVTGGTSDIPVAEEAAITVSMFANKVDKLYDVGVAGIHRLLAHEEKLRSASVIIVVAGMEGALPSVVGGLVDIPVIAVPTSIGYGASFGGISALLSMLNSCASGITVVNIDNGFGAGFAASVINRQIG